MWIAGLWLVLSGVWLTPVHATARCFADTAYCIDGTIRTYWESHGGLVVFGLPIGAATQHTVEGVTLRTQLFERNRIEIHPNNSAPYDMQLGLLGSEYLANTTGTSIAPVGSIDEVDSAGVAKATRRDCQWFTTTQQYVCGDFYAYWRQYGIASRARGPFSLAENTALFGLPITGVYQQTIQGQAYAVQIFERARFEFHPANPVPYRVQLGLLGRELIADVANAPQITPDLVAIAVTPTPFRVTDYLLTPGILPDAELLSFRSSMPSVGYWNSNGASDITVIIRDIGYFAQLKGQRAVNGKKYVVGTVTVINNRPSDGAACRVHFADLSMIDLAGTWRASDKITTIIDTPLTYKIIKPGQRVEGRVAFMVPSNSAPGQLVAQFANEQPTTIELRVWPHTK